MIRRDLSLVWAVCSVFLMVEMASQAKETSEDQSKGKVGNSHGDYVMHGAGSYAGVFKRKNEIPSDEAQGKRFIPNSDRDPSQLVKLISHPERPNKSFKPSSKGKTWNPFQMHRAGSYDGALVKK
ncbi:uncharacterized protein LOC144646984 isoform X3 [Oculina patagonica]